MSEDPRGGYQKHGHPAETIGLAAVAALGLEAILPAAGAPGWVLPAVEILASSGAAFVTWSFTGRKIFPLYLAAAGSFLGTWTAWAGSNPWHGSTFAVWLAGLAVLIPWGVLAWHRRAGKEPQAPRFPAIEAVPEVLMLAPQPSEEDIEREKFATMFADHGITAGKDPFTGEDVPVDVYSVKEDRAGRTVRIKLPRSGKVTIEEFRSRARNFEPALSAQDGAVSFDFGTDSTEVVMKVRERDGLAGTARLTPELRASTVNEEFIVGVQEDESYLKITVRESHIMIIGIMGSGKSNFLNVLIAQLASMVDTVIWMVDMKGGRAARPWFQAWNEGRADAPPIDWLATTRDEAEKMIRALRTAVETRSASGIGGNKIIPSPERPQIIFICDEMADLFGDSVAPTRTELDKEKEDQKNNTWFVRQGTWLTQHARSEAVTTAWASQRGTNGMSGSGDMKANIDIAVALKPKKAADLQYILPDVPQLAARQVSMLTNTPGVGMLAKGPHNSQITKFLWHDHLEGVCGVDESDPRCPPECPVYQTEVEVGPVRPRLDTLTASPLGADYAQRWVRARNDGVLKIPDRVLSGGSAAHGYSGSGNTGDFDEIVKRLEDPEAGVHPARLRARSWLASRGIVGGTVKQATEVLKDEFGDAAPARETVHRWFAEDRDNGLVHHPAYRLWKSGDGPNKEDGDDD